MPEKFVIRTSLGSHNSAAVDGRLFHHKIKHDDTAAVKFTTLKHCNQICAMVYLACSNDYGYVPPVI